MPNSLARKDALQKAAGSDLFSKQAVQKAAGSDLFSKQAVLFRGIASDFKPLFTGTDPNALAARFLL